jgi:multidrug resistance efflux pump
LPKLDPRDYQVALAQTKASFEQAKAQLAQSQAQLIQADAQLKAQAQAEAVEAQRDNSQRNFQRNYQLFYQGKGVISKQELDNAQYQFEGNEAAVAAVKVAEANLQTAKAQEKAAAAQVEVASAQVQNAELQLSYTTVYAPTDGRVAQKTFETGQRGVSPTKVRKVPQDSCQLPGRKGFSAIPELPRRDLV